MRSSLGALCAPPLVANRQNVAPITVSDAGHGNPSPPFGDPTRAQVRDSTYYVSDAVDTAYVEVLRLDFGSSILIQDATLQRFGAQDHYGSGGTTGMQWYLSADLAGTSNLGAAGSSTTANSLADYAYTINASARYISVWVKSITSATASLYTIDAILDCLSVTGTA